MKEKNCTGLDAKEIALIEYLERNDFDKKYQKLAQKLKGKKIIIYGTGLMFQVIQNNYDLSGFDIIGISDMKYSDEDEGNVEFGYKIVPKLKIPDYDPDVVLIATQKYFPILETFTLQAFKDTKIAFIPFVSTSFWKMLLNIWR